MCPIAQADRHDGPRLVDEAVPGKAAVIDDVVVGLEDAVGEPVVADELPDVFDRVELGRLRRQLPPVTISPHCGSESTWTIRTLLQSASSSSARMRASAVPTCWPISARMMLTVTVPLGSIPYQIVGSNKSLTPPVAGA